MQKWILSVLIAGCIYVHASQSHAVECARNLPPEPTASEFIRCIKELENSNLILKRQMDDLQCTILEEKVSKKWQSLQYRIMESDLAQMKRRGPILDLSLEIKELINVGGDCAYIKQIERDAILMHKVLNIYVTKENNRHGIISLLENKETKNYADYSILYGTYLHLAQLSITNQTDRNRYFGEAIKSIKNSHEDAKRNYFGPRKTYIIQKLKCASINSSVRVGSYINCLKALVEHSSGSVTHLNLAEALTVNANMMFNEMKLLREKRKHIDNQESESRKIEIDQIEKNIRNLHLSISNKLEEALDHIDIFSGLNDHLCASDILEKSGDNLKIFEEFVLLKPRLDKALSDLC